MLQPVILRLTLNAAAFAAARPTLLFKPLYKAAVPLPEAEQTLVLPARYLPCSFLIRVSAVPCSLELDKIAFFPHRVEGSSSMVKKVR